MKSQVPESFWTIHGVALRYHVSDKTIRRLITARKLKAHRIGSQLRISNEDLELFEKLQRGAQQ